MKKYKPFPHRSSNHHNQPPPPPQQPPPIKEIIFLCVYIFFYNLQKLIAFDCIFFRANTNASDASTPVKFFYQQMDTTEKAQHGESKKPLYDLGVEWQDLDLKKFMLIGSGVYLAECAIIYPFELIKTQLQVDKVTCTITTLTFLKGSTSFFKDARRRTKEIVRTQGIRGLYHGYWPSTLFSLPSQGLYIMSYNYFKDALERKYPSESHQRGHRAWVTLTAGNK